jgi:protein-L-isoaspartate(D-aspartate) O-methyltransferase
MPLQVDRETELAIVRRAYAKQILALVDVDDARIEAAFAQVPREHYLGPGPWQLMRGILVYLKTPSDDPVYVYMDCLFGLVPGKGVNNGQPSLHVAWMANAAIAAGEHVVHVGAGTGYYTAILAHLVGPAGRVTAIEFDPELASRAAMNLKGVENVHVITGDACTLSFDPADVIYVNAGFSRIPLTWLDGLRDGGRVLLPMGSAAGFKDLRPGALDMARMVRLAKSQVVFRIERRGEEFHVRPGVPAAFIPAEGADPAAEVALVAALENDGARKVTRVYRGGDISDERCWLRGEGWCLAYT